MHSNREVRIDSVQVTDWVNEMQEAARSKKSKIKPVIYPIFQEAKEYLSDGQWIAKFEQASRGKFPPKITYHNQRLSKKGQKHVYLDIPNDPREAKDRILGFFMAHSPRPDFVNETAALPDAPALDPITWGKVSKKTRDALKSYYIIDQKIAHKLNKRELGQLRQILNFGLVNRIFHKDTVHVHNKRIVAIEGLLWDDDKRQYYIEPELLKNNLARPCTKYRESDLFDNIPSKDTIPQFGLRLNKYLESLDRKRKEAHKHLDSPFLGYQVQVEGKSNFDITEEDLDECEEEFEVVDEFE